MTNALGTGAVCCGDRDNCDVVDCKLAEKEAKAAAKARKTEEDHE